MKKKSFQGILPGNGGAPFKRAKAEDSLSEKAGRMDAVFLDMMEKLACGMISLVNGFNPQKLLSGMRDSGYLTIISKYLRKR